jgi:ferrous iron transport protein B
MTFPQLPESRVEHFDQQKQAVEQEVAATAAQENLSDEDKAKLLEEKLAEIKAKQGEAELEYSVAGRLGHAIEPVMSLAGFNWQTNIALIGALPPRRLSSPPWGPPIPWARWIRKSPKV